MPPVAIRAGAVRALQSIAVAGRSSIILTFATARDLMRSLTSGKGNGAVADAADDHFELFDLRVDVICPEGAPIYCGANPGDHFELRGEMLTLPPGQGISIYSLAAVLPLLAAKQRPSDPHDWMTSDAEIACPDPHCGSRLRISRLGRRRFSHAATTAVPLPPR